MLTLSRTSSTFFDDDPDPRPFTASATGGSRPYPVIAQRHPFPDIYQAAIHQDVAAVKEMIKHDQPYLGVFLFKLKTNRPTQTSSRTLIRPTSPLSSRISNSWHPRRTSRTTTLRGIYDLCIIVISQSSPIHASVLGEYMHCRFPPFYESPLTHSRTLCSTNAR